MSEFSVYKLGSKEWANTLRSCKIFDFYHTSLYHSLESTSYEAELLVFANGDDLVACPIMIRPIENTSHFDVTSVYGYTGPIANKPFQDFSGETLVRFRESIKIYFDDRSIISAFMRLHPLIESSIVFEDFGKVIDLNKTVTIDLRLPIDEQRRKFRKSNKSELNQLRRKGYEVKKVETQEELAAFIAIYEETMDRVNAKRSYYFSKEYYNSFFKNDEFDSYILIATFEEKIIAGAIFTVTNNIMQYHLAGTTADFIRVTPMKLILDEARLLGSQLGLDFLHLGGGVGGSDEDSLFRFKSGFSDLYTQFSVWNYVHNATAYEELVAEKCADTSSAFFPLYRS